MENSTLEKASAKLAQDLAEKLEIQISEEFVDLISQVIKSGDFQVHLTQPDIFFENGQVKAEQRAKCTYIPYQKVLDLEAEIRALKEENEGFPVLFDGMSESLYELFEEIKELKQEFRKTHASPWTELSFNEECGWRFDWQYLGNTRWHSNIKDCLREAVILGKEIMS